MLNLSTLNVCARARWGAVRLTARRRAGIRSECLFMRVPVVDAGGSVPKLDVGLGVCQRATEYTIPAPETLIMLEPRPTLSPRVRHVARPLDPRQLHAERIRHSGGSICPSRRKIGRA